MSYLFLMMIASYLIGSIPTSILTGKFLRGIDIRNYGSGNAGATNVFRVLGWKAGFFVLLVDISKGFVATSWMYRIAESATGWPAIDLQIIAGLCAILGHIWTVFAGFRGGKGVGTGAGVVIALAPFAVLVGILIFVGVVTATRYVSLGSILASISVPLTIFTQHFLLQQNIPYQLLIISFFIPVLIIYTHRSNIQRLLRGHESKIKFTQNK